MGVNRLLPIDVEAAQRRHELILEVAKLFSEIGIDVGQNALDVANIDPNKLSEFIDVTLEVQSLKAKASERAALIAKQQGMLTADPNGELNQIADPIQRGELEEDQKRLDDLQTKKEEILSEARNKYDSEIESYFPKSTPEGKIDLKREAYKDVYYYSKLLAFLKNPGQTIELADTSGNMGNLITKANQILDKDNPNVNQFTQEEVSQIFDAIKKSRGWSNLPRSEKSKIESFFNGYAKTEVESENEVKSEQISRTLAAGGTTNIFGSNASLFNSNQAVNLVYASPVLISGCCSFFAFQQLNIGSDCFRRSCRCNSCYTCYQC